VFTAAEAGIRDGSSAPVDDGGVWGRVPTTSQGQVVPSFQRHPRALPACGLKSILQCSIDLKICPLAVIHRVVLLAGKALTVIYIGLPRRSTRRLLIKRHIPQST